MKKVKCITKTGIDITYNKIYDVVKVIETYILVENDYGNNIWYAINGYFEDIQLEYDRNEIITELLS